MKQIVGGNMKKVEIKVALKSLFYSENPYFVRLNGCSSDRIIRKTDGSISELYCE